MEHIYSAVFFVYQAKAVSISSVQMLPTSFCIYYSTTGVTNF